MQPLQPQRGRPKVPWGSELMTRAVPGGVTTSAVTAEAGHRAQTSEASELLTWRDTWPRVVK
jgi:hypothetical protein